MKNPRTYLLILLLTPVIFIGTTSLAYASSILTDGLQSILWTIVNQVFGSIFGWAGLLLNFGINEFIIGFGTNFLNTGVGLTVDTLWETVRDIFNLTFIFGLVYIGFKMILNSDDSGTKRWLIHLVMAALLVNFSLYITKFIVDLSNITASQIVRNGFPQLGGLQSNISGYFADRLGLTSLWGDNTIDVMITAGVPLWGYIFGVAIILIVGAFVFAVGGIMLIIRYASLALYMVMSPLMFLGWVFPNMQSYSDRYWRGFLGRAFYAPIYVLLIFFAAKIIDAFYVQNSVKNGSPQFAEMFLGTQDGVNAFYSTLPPFILAGIFMIAAVVVGQKLGADGASAVSSMVKKTAIKGGRFVTTQTAGRAAQQVSDRTGNLVNRKFTQLQNSDNISGKIARIGGVDRTVRGATGAMKGAKFGLSTTRDQDISYKATIDKRVSNAQTLTRGLTDGASESDKIKAQGVINNLSKAQMEELFVSDRKTFDQVVGKLKDGQFDSLMDSDKLNDNDKNSVYETRTNAIKDFYQKNGVVVSDLLQNLTTKQIETLGDEFITENAHLLSQSQIDSITKPENTNFTNTQKGSYLQARKTKLVEASQSADKVETLFKHNTADNPGSYTKSKKAAEIANLPFDVFIHPETGVNVKAIKQINGSVLEEIFNKKIRTIEERNALRDAVLKNGNDDAIGYLNSTLGARNWNTQVADTKKNTEPSITLSSDVNTAKRDTGRG